MGLDIVTNVMAQDASNSLAVNEGNMQNSLQKLSSGYRINKAADDASGLVISQHLQAQIGGFQQAQANTQSAINVVQTADGALNEVGVILQRVRTLAVESANTSATDSTAQQAAQSEVTQSLASIQNIAQTTVYGNHQLLVNGTATTVNYGFQVGYDGSSASQVSFSVTALNLADIGLVQNALTLPSSALNISSAVGNVAAGVNTIQVTAATAADVQGATFTITSGSFAVTSGSSFTISVDGGTTVTVQYAAATYTVAGFEALVTAALVASGYSGTAVSISTNSTGFLIADATTGGSASIVISAGGSAGLSSTSATGVDASVSLDGATAVSVTTAQNVAGGVVDVTNQQGASVALTLGGALSTGSINATQTYSQLNALNFSVTSSTAISTVDNAIATVSAMRGTLGAYQNELQHISDNESVMVQNLQASNAQIQDTNMASEMVNFTQDQVLVQSGISMLAQANQIPQMVLKLIG